MDIDFEIMREPGFFNQVFEKRTSDIEAINEHGGWKTVINCPICGCNKNREIQHVTDYCRYIKCDRCDCIYADKIPKQQNIGRYTLVEKIETLPEEKKRKYRIHRFAVERINIIRDHLKKPLGQSSLLDIGCNTGFFLEEAKKHFKSVEGHEQSTSLANYASEKLGITVHTCELSCLNGKYDVITLFDVLEHIENPLLFLKEAKRLLDNRGIILAYTPNYRSLSFELLDKNCNHLYPGHVVLFSLNTSCYLAKKLHMFLIMSQTRGMDYFDLLAFERDINNMDISLICENVNKWQNCLDLREEANSLRFILER